MTLAGLVLTADDKLAAERAVQQIPGVHAVAEEIDIYGEEPLEMAMRRWQARF